MAELFNVNRPAIVKHISNILNDKELENSICSILEQVQIEGNRKITRKIKIYNLEMIISVGYRVKSQRGIVFRRWANKVLKEYLSKNALLNKSKLVISSGTLTALTLLVAESDPKEKEIMVRVVMNILFNKM